MRSQNEIDYYIDYNNQMFEELEKLRNSPAEKKIKADKG